MARRNSASHPENASAPHAQTFDDYP